MSTEHRAIEAMLVAQYPTWPHPFTTAARQRLRDDARKGLAAALHVLGREATNATRFELRALAEQLDHRCPDCGRHLTRDPWSHCATCEPTRISGETP